MQLLQKSQCKDIKITRLNFHQTGTLHDKIHSLSLFLFSLKKSPGCQETLQNNFAECMLMMMLRSPHIPIGMRAKSRPSPIAGIFRNNEM